MGRTFVTSVYYPGLGQGTDVPLDPSLGPYPGAAFGHGFLMNRKRYDFYGRHLATHGYVVILLNFTDLDNERQCSELAACLTWMEEKNTDPGSWLYGGIDTVNFAVSGHSMGGGVAVDLAGKDGRVDVCAPLAPGTTPDEVSELSMPVMILAGDRDGIIPIDRIEWMYEGAHSPSVLATIFGGNHCQFMDISYPWEELFDGVPGITREEQLRLTNLYTTACYGYYLKGIGEYRSYLYGYRGGADPGIDRDADSGEALDLVIVPAVLEVEPGTSFDFAVTVTNREEILHEPEARTLVRIDGEVVLDPALGPHAIRLDPGESLTLEAAQFVAETTPGLTADYVVAVEEGTLEMEDSFTISVVPGP